MFSTRTPAPRSVLRNAREAFPDLATVHDGEVAAVTYRC